MFYQYGQQLSTEGNTGAAFYDPDLLPGRNMDPHLEVRTRGGSFGPGGYGGGLFDGSYFSGLGAIRWNAYDSAVLAIQKSANKILVPLNYAPLKEDGYLGPATCGAIRYLYADIPIQELEFLLTEAEAFAMLVEDTRGLENACMANESQWMRPARLGPPPGRPSPSSDLQPPPVEPEPDMEFLEPEVLAPPGACEFEYGDSHGQIAELQTQLNVALDQQGYEGVPVTGVYDAKTCGAIFELRGTFNPEPSTLCPGGWVVPFECSDMELPKKKDGSGGMSRAAMFGIGGLVLAAAAVGTYAMTKTT